MKQAYLFINTAIGSSKSALMRLKEMEGVTASYLVWGVYDIALQIQGNNYEQLRQQAQAIKQLDEVKGCFTVVLRDPQPDETFESQETRKQP
jgi:hypothetical protein